ncbi:hypothetical protein B0H66DRAFT_644124 [Apodospora peruviana]|uniref:Uncharacterized protein n=1 Tax=Apodospora peruviana TaxID=516989 RepID=A0AAE0HU90_9PEZI|nr:hypothetical protein B0H66DRAFT_644124 [Apodospora peruviana]
MDATESNKKALEQLQLQHQYNIGIAVIDGIFIIPLTIIWVISLVRAPRNRDPARVGVGWLKAVFPIKILSLIMYLIGDALFLSIPIPGAYGPYDMSHFAASLYRLQALQYIAILGLLFRNIADVLLLVTFAELASGVSICLHGGLEKKGAAPFSKVRVGRYAAYAIVFVLFLLAIVYFGIKTEFSARYYKWHDEILEMADENGIVNNPPPMPIPARSTDHLYSAINILLWVSLLPIIGYGSYVVHKARKPGFSHLRNSAVLLLTATLLDFAHLFTNVIIVAYYYVPRKSPPSPIYLTVILPILNTVPTFIALVLLFVMVTRKGDNGLWATRAAVLP